MYTLRYHEHFFATSADSRIVTELKKACALNEGSYQPGLEVIKLEYSLRLKIKQIDWLLADMNLLKHTIYSPPPPTKVGRNSGFGMDKIR